MAPTITMYDATHYSARNIPATARKVAGHVSGSGKWTAADWARCPYAGRVRVDQTPAGSMFATGDADVYDIRDRTGWAGMFPGLVEQRITRGIGWSAGHGDRHVLNTVIAALDAYTPAAGGGAGWWRGHVDWWLSDPSLPLAEADRLVGTEIDGIPVRAVKWAGPGSRPDVEIADGLTLGGANISLSVAAAEWFAGPQLPAQPWQEDALSMARQAGKILGELTAILQQQQQ